MNRSTVFPSSRASKDRFQLHGNPVRGYGSGAALMPLGNRRMVPSKWEDAEKWICSPVAADGLAVKISELPVNRRRRPKSKSGPLGPHYAAAVGEETYPSALMMVSDFDDKRARTFATNSPDLREGSMENDGFSGGSINGMAGSIDGWEDRMDGCAMRVASPGIGWSELLMEASSSFTSSQEEKSYLTYNDTSSASNVLRKDVGTQMSPESSPARSPSLEHCTSSHPPHSLTIGELHKQFAKLEVRDVQVDDQAAVKRWLKKYPDRAEKNSSKTKQNKNKTMTGKLVPKIEAEEARIVAWENLQKAKAEAAIKELEMKLEKKRASSMDKIMNKLSSAEKKAEEMRKSLAACHSCQTTESSRKSTMSKRINRLSFLDSCFYHHAL